MSPSLATHLRQTRHTWSSAGLRTRWGTRLLATGALVVGMTVSARAQDLSDVQALKGLSGVRVMLGQASAAAAAHGLGQAELRASIEARLQAGGILVLSASDRSRGMPTLLLDLQLAAVELGNESLFVYSLDLALTQEVRLVRAPAVRLVAPTWQLPGSVGTVDPQSLATVHKAVNESVDVFIKAYRAANGS